MSIVVDRVSKRFGTFVALDEVSLDIPSGELVGLLGPSGCGKTTLLRVIAGLEEPDTGAIHLDGAPSTNRHVRDREVGFVFQHYALFRHMTVRENIAFGLTVRPKAQRPDRAAIARRVHELLQLVQLDFVAGRYPHELSGGQKQRIALARALAVEPRVLLLDEPFGALDANVRKELRRWLRRLHEEIHVTTVFVTHDQEEALEIASRVVVMNKGHVEQIGSPEEVYAAPATPFVSRFLGSVNLFHGRVHDGVAQIGELATAVDTAGGTASLHLRPHEIEVSDQAEGAICAATVQGVYSVGPVVRLELAGEGGTGLIEAELPRERYLEQPWGLGARVYVRPRELRVYVDAA
jgi:sulfate transport system ATP-binding protein